MRNYNVIIILLVVIVSIPLSNCTGQFKYKSVPINLVKKESISISISSFRKLTDYLPANFDKTGKTDYTAVIQKAINENRKVLLPDYPLLVSDKGIFLKSNNEIYFQKNTKLILKASKLKKYGVINIHESENIILYNPTIIGDRKNHIGKGGEWGMGIFVLAGKNVKIVNPRISNCWGDGIYLGSFSSSKTNIDISILGGLIDNNRRNGMSIISGKNILIKNVLLSNTNGTLPMAGIDLEPNRNMDNLNNIHIENVLSYNNSECGFLIYLGSMLGNQLKDIDIRIVNCEDHFSKNGISIPGLRNDYKKDIKRLAGGILIEGFSSFDNDVPFARSSGNYIYTPSINVNRMKVYRNKQRSYDNEKNLTDWMKKSRMKINTN